MIHVHEQRDNPPADHDSEDGGMMQAAVGVALTAAGVGISSYCFPV